MTDTLRDELATSIQEIDFANRVVRLHCPITWPDHIRCLNCQQRFPCQSYTWAVVTLAGAGWNEDEINALDKRTGPWA